MDRTVYISVGGKNYPMRKTIGATRRITEKFGGIGNIPELVDQASDTERLKIFTDLLEILIAQGCAYKNLFEKDLPVPEDAPVVNGEYIPVTSEELEVGLDIDDADMIMDKITECFSAGGKKTIGSEEKEAKNGEAM